MTALPLAPSCLRLKTVGTIGSSPLTHILHAQYTGGPLALADVTTIANAFRTQWNLNIGPCVGPNVTYKTFECTDLASATGATYVNTTAVGGSHAQGSQILPLSTCIVISWKVGLHYRGGHPRTYLPFANSADLNNGNSINGTYQGLVQTSAQAFLTGMNAVTSGPVTIALAMVSYFHNHTLRPAGLPFLITNATVHGRSDTMRRRLGKEFG